MVFNLRKPENQTSPQGSIAAPTEAVKDVIRIMLVSNKREERDMASGFTAVFEREGPWYIAYCPEIPGANGQAKTKEEARASLTEAIALVPEDSNNGTFCFIVLRENDKLTVCRFCSHPRLRRHFDGSLPGHRAGNRKRSSSGPSPSSLGEPFRSQESEWGPQQRISAPGSQNYARARRPLRTWRMKRFHVR